MYSSPLLHIFSGIHIALFASILYFLQKLKTENCECALIEPYDKLYKATIVFLCFRIVMFILDIALRFKLQNIMVNSRPVILYSLATFSILMLIAYFIYFIYSIKYINQLYILSCKCSDNSWRLVYYIYSIYTVIMLSLFFLVLFIAIVLLINLQWSIASRRHPSTRAPATKTRR